MSEEFREGFLLAEFEHWSLLLFDQQHPYVGQCVAWATRADADRYLDMTEAESEELRTRVIPIWFEALSNWLTSQGQPAPYRENISIMGNTMPHLHVHLIPRYEEPVEVFGVRFVDERPREHYVTYDEAKIDDQVVQEISKALSRAVQERK